MNEDAHMITESFYKAAQRVSNKNAFQIIKPKPILASYKLTLKFQNQ